MDKKGLFPKIAILLPILNPTCRQTTKPGPLVDTIPSKSLISFFAFFKAFSIIASIFSICDLAAISGTTPPNFLCSLNWLETIFDKIFAVPSGFSVTTAAAVSSQLVSIPKKVSFFSLN